MSLRVPYAARRLQCGRTSGRGARACGRVIDGTCRGHPQSVTGSMAAEASKMATIRELRYGTNSEWEMESGETDKDADQRRDQRRTHPPLRHRAAGAESG